MPQRRPWSDTASRASGSTCRSVEKMIPVAAGRLGRGRLATASELPGLAEAVAAEAGVEPVPIDDLIHDVRLIKDLDEVHRIGRSFELSLVAQAAVEAGASVPGVSGDRVLLRRAGRRPGRGRRGRSTSAATCSSARAPPRSAAPSPCPGASGPQQGDVIVADIALRYHGYWGDTARTLHRRRQRRGGRGPGRRSARSWTTRPSTCGPGCAGATCSRASPPRSRGASRAARSRTTAATASA